MSTSSITLGFIALAAKSQLSVAVSMAFEIKPLLSDKGFKLSQYARMVALDSVDSISEKTAANYASIAKKLALKFDAKLGLYDFTSNDVSLFVNFLTSEVANLGYTSSLDDIGAYCDGKPSQKAVRLAAIEAQRLAQEAIMQAQQQKQAEQKTAEQVKAEQAEEQRKQAEAQAEKAQAERVKAEQEKQEAESKKQEAQAQAQALKQETAELQLRAEQAEAEALAAKAEAAAAAEVARKESESTCITVKVGAEGQAIIEMVENMHPDFLEAVIKQLQAEHKALKKAMLQAA